MRRIGLAGLLVGAGQSELGGGVMRVKLQGVLKGGDGFGELLELGVGRSEEIPGVGVVRINFGYVTEGVDGGACVR